MRRGEIYRVRRPADDPKPARCFVIVSRQTLIDSRFSSVICAPVFTRAQGLSTQVPVGLDEGLKHESFVLCDNLVSVYKRQLTGFVGTLSPTKMMELDRALRTALSIG